MSGNLIVLPRYASQNKSRHGWPRIWNRLNQKGRSSNNGKYERVAVEALPSKHDAAELFPAQIFAGQRKPGKRKTGVGPRIRRWRSKNSDCLQSFSGVVCESEAFQKLY